MQTVYTVLILLLVVGGTRLLAQLLPLPLPLIQIASGGGPGLATPHQRPAGGRESAGRHGMTKKVPRQADVAREAGVSQSTVSQVLGGGGDLTRISPETQRRVISAARQLRYRPSAQQRRAVERRQAPLLLGVHTFEPIFPTSARDYYFAFLQGIEEQSGVEGCNLVLFTAARDEGGVRRIYRDDVNGLGQAAGSILLGHRAHMDDLARLAADGHPFVYVGRREVPGADIAYVGGDYRSTTGRILDDLVAMGHRTFAYLGEAVRHEPQADRWAGFSTALDRFGLPVPRPLYVAPDQLARAASSQAPATVFARATTIPSTACCSAVVSTSASVSSRSTRSTATDPSAVPAAGSSRRRPSSASTSSPVSSSRSTTSTMRASHWAPRCR